jgi:hypothetical protein
MRALQVEFLCNGVCVDFHREGVFIGVNGTSTDLEKLIWCQVVAGWPSHVASRPSGAASTNFLHQLGLLLLVWMCGNEVLGRTALNPGRPTNELSPPANPWAHL